MITRVPGYPCPPYHAAAQTQKGDQIVYGNPGTQIPVSASSAAAQTLKGEKIVYGNPGRVPGYPCLPGPGYPVPVHRPSPGRVPDSKFQGWGATQILRLGCNSISLFSYIEHIKRRS